MLVVPIFLNRPFSHISCPTLPEALPLVSRTRTLSTQRSLSASHLHVALVVQMPHVDMLRSYHQHCRSPFHISNLRPQDRSSLSVHLNTIVSVSFRAEK